MFRASLVLGWVSFNLEKGFPVLRFLCGQRSFPGVT